MRRPRKTFPEAVADLNAVLDREPFYVRLVFAMAIAWPVFFAVLMDHKTKLPAWYQRTGLQILDAILSVWRRLVGKDRHV